MIRLLKKLWKAMIQIGSTTIDTIFQGSTTPDHIDVGSTQVWPDVAPTYYITLSSTGATVGSGGTQGTITVTTNYSNWTVESSDTSWLTASKSNSGTCRYYTTENDMVDERTATLSFKITGTTYATFTVRQSGAALLLVIYPTTLNLPYATQTSSFTSVTANTTNWTVTASPSSAITASKTSNTRIDWTIQANTGTTGRYCYITVSYGGTSVQETIYQPSGYYVDVLNTSPMSIAAGTTTFQVSVISRLDQTAVQPTVTFSGNNAINAAVSSVTQGGNTGQFNYTFTCDANQTQTQRATTITFSVDNGNTYDSITIQQAGQAPAPVIGNIQVKVYVGDWVLGTLKTSETTIPGMGTLDINTLVIATTGAIQTNYTYSVDVLYQTGPTTTGGSPTQNTITRTNQTITAGTSFTDPYDGITYYGIQLTGGPRLTILQVNTFTVTQET